ncbi:hypothetical protein [Vibrio sp. 1CM23M]|uniref:hypothetical protein n=1 Tax=Vibrio sp. 1CM23M TaxID=2929164 RepID=UPI0020BF18A7|nr:hypothetical protein [Vibrio sp. 1CM23M]MCK8072438.1 hypothetical protein [Vibrio sp. 1CM23M]
MTINDLLNIASKDNTEVLMYESLTLRYSKVIFRKQQFFFSYEEGIEIQKVIGDKL